MILPDYALTPKMATLNKVTNFGLLKFSYKPLNLGSEVWTTDVICGINKIIMHEVVSYIN